MSLRTSDVAGVEAVILPSTRDLGDGFTVRRALPSAHRRMVGPFIFFDQMGPAVFRDGEGLDARPHPHIGLATVTYLLEGEIMHRDSVGSVQSIRPGEVNWMTAGSGIVHSERTSSDMRSVENTLLGLQTWLALPVRHEEAMPAFEHYKADQIPKVDDGGMRMTLIAGATDGVVSPVNTFSDLVYADIMLDSGTRFRPSVDHVERAIYVVQGEVAVLGQTGAFTANELVILKPGAEVILMATSPVRLMLIGGEPFPEKRHIFWNFVSSREERIEQAKEDWRNHRFAKVAGDDEFIPLPEQPEVVRYP